MTESPVAADAATLPSRSYRAAVANVVLASIVSALHVGKATIALPSLQHEFGGSLASLSGIMSVFPFVGVFGGIAAGLLVRRWGDRLLLIAGLVILGVSSVAGAWAGSFTLLLATRFVEGRFRDRGGCRAGRAESRDAARAAQSRIWPMEHVHAGRHGAVDAGRAAARRLAQRLARGRGADARRGGCGARHDVGGCAVAAGRRAAHQAALRDVLASRSTTLLALGFATYNVQFFAAMTFLPVFLMQRLGVAVGAAG